ncbi:sphingosine 1-phosphate receptor 1-like [Anneissia japonica]|uniref:sphingosine 1-phosphate receptor 1-like n=1 Tax=Anneissia japonica TaxID=1529436 RepID=UPI001425B91B|nr:sphingosine 1-phosphate receptor 1-like [Anneissia japonica]
MIIPGQEMSTTLTPDPNVAPAPEGTCRQLNYTYETFVITETERIVLILMFPISVVVLLGNVWIFKTIFKMRTRKKYYHIIGSLTVSDSCLMIMCIFVAHECLHNKRSFIYLDYKPDIRWVGGSYFEVMSLLHVILLAFERCVAVKYPFKHRQLQKKHFIYAIATLWITSVFITAILYTSSYYGYSKCRFGTVYLNNGTVVLTVVIAIAFHSIILKTATKPTREIAGSINKNNMTRHRSITRLSKSDLKAARTTFMVLLGFIVCVTPYVIASNIAYSKHTLDNINTPAVTIGYFLAILNAVMNSLVYGLLNAELRRSALAPLRAFFCCKEEVATHNQSRRGSENIFRVRVNNLEECPVGFINEKCAI